MATEIELKAHVANSEALKLLLGKKAEYRSAFEKEDGYWFTAWPSGLSSSGLRVRREKRTFPDGTVESATLVTFKNKEVRDGVEINDEREFEANSFQVFEELLGRIGLKQGAAKKKRGWTFTCDGITAELTEVESLGWFVELEILADNDLEETVAKAKKRLWDFFDGLNIGRQAIESRFYTEMLRAKP